MNVGRCKGVSILWISKNVKDDVLNISLIVNMGVDTIENRPSKASPLPPGQIRSHVDLSPRRVHEAESVVVDSARQGAHHAARGKFLTFSQLGSEKGIQSKSE